MLRNFKKIVDNLLNNDKTGDILNILKTNDNLKNSLLTYSTEYFSTRLNDSDKKSAHLPKDNPTTSNILIQSTGMQVNPVQTNFDSHDLALNSTTSTLTNEESINSLSFSQSTEKECTLT